MTRGPEARTNSATNTEEQLMADAIAIILAAGKSKRMMSETPKVLHPACGRPIVEYVLDAARAAGAKRIIVVVGHKAEVVEAALKHHPDVEFALQAEQKGTGHAVMMCREAVGNHNGPVLVLTGDTPLLKGASLKGLLDDLQQHNAACVVEPPGPRTIRGWAGSFATHMGTFCESLNSGTRLPRSRRSPRSIPAASRMTASPCSRLWPR